MLPSAGLPFRMSGERKLTLSPEKSHDNDLISGPTMAAKPLAVGQSSRDETQCLSARVVQRQDAGRMIHVSGYLFVYKHF